MKWLAESWDEDGVTCTLYLREMGWSSGNYEERFLFPHFKKSIWQKERAFGAPGDHERFNRDSSIKLKIAPVTLRTLRV